MVAPEGHPPEPALAPEPDTDLGRPALLVLLVFALALLLLTKSEPVSWADASRLGTIQALAEEGTLALDDTAYFWQGDKVLIEGRYYSHQPPMLALLGTVPYWLLHQLGGEITDPWVYRTLTLSLVGMPLFAGLSMLGILMRRRGASQLHTALLLAAAAFGTLALPYALVLNQHGAAAALVLASLLAIDLRRPLVAGLLLSLATTIDLTAVFFAVALVVPIVWREDESGTARLQLADLIPYTLGALPILGLHFGVTHAIAGDLKPLGLHTEGFLYPLSPFLFMNLTGGGEAGPDGSQLAYVVGALFGESGLFSHHPVLLWALGLGLLFLLRPGTKPAVRSARPLAIGVLLASLGIAGYYLTQSRNFGGSSFGMRWFTVFAPALLLLPALALASGRRLALGLFVPLLLWSTAAASLGAAQPWAKFHYRYEDSPLGMVARPGDPRPSRVEYWGQEWRRITSLEERYTRKNFDDLYQRLMDQHQRLYLRDLPGVEPEAAREWVESGLAKLQHAVDLLDRDNSSARSRPMGHFFLGKFHQRLDDRRAAKQEYERALALDPGNVWAKQALDKLHGH